MPCTLNSYMHSSPGDLLTFLLLFSSSLSCYESEISRSFIINQNTKLRSERKSPLQDRVSNLIHARHAQPRTLESEERGNMKILRGTLKQVTATFSTQQFSVTPCYFSQQWDERVSASLKKF